MDSNWYNGYYSLNWLEISTDRLHSIHANAFAGQAFHYLTVLDLYIANGDVNIHSNAFEGLRHLVSIFFDAQTLHRLPIGLFDPLATKMWILSFDIWPNSINLNEMFAREAFRMMKSLDISNVELPQTYFRVLSAANFTAFRRLQELHLLNCGIEVIHERTFDKIAHTLVNVYLKSNWIKTINLAMFRHIFEKKHLAWLKIGNNRERWLCTCDLLEVTALVCPLMTKPTKMCVNCTLTDKFLRGDCGIRHNLESTSFCVEFKQKIYIRIIRVQITYATIHSIAIKTNFSSGIRLILANFDTMQHKKCAHRAADAHYKCLQITKATDRMALDAVHEIRDAELISITVIPILYRFGAKPVHSMTVRRARHDATPIDAWQLLGAAWMACILSSIVGFAGAISAAHLAHYLKYNQPMQMDETTQTPFEEVMQHDNNN